MTARLTLLTAPTGEPLSIDKAKLFCRCYHDQENELFLGWIKSARNHVESITSRQLLPATWLLTLPSFPPFNAVSSVGAVNVGANEIDLPRTPVTSAVLKYYDTDNLLQTWAAENWQLSGDEVAATISEAEGSSWPATYSREDAVHVEFVAGYGAEAVGQEFVDAMQTLVLSSYLRQPWSESLLESVANMLATKTTRRYS